MMAKVENFTGAKLFKIDLIFDTHLFEPSKLTREYVLRIFAERGLLSKGVRVFVEEVKPAVPANTNEGMIEIRYRCSRCHTPHPVGSFLVCCAFDDMDGNINAAESWEPGTGEKISKSDLAKELDESTILDEGRQGEDDPRDDYDGPDEAQEWADFDPDA